MPLTTTPQIADIEVFDRIDSNLVAEFFSPTSITQLSNGNVVIAYTLDANNQYEVRYGIFDPAGNRINDEQSVPDSGVGQYQGEVHAYDNGFLIIYDAIGDNVTNFVEYVRFDNNGSVIGNGVIIPEAEQDTAFGRAYHMVQADGTILTTYNLTDVSGESPIDQTFLATVSNGGQTITQTEIASAAGTLLIGAVELPDGHIMALSRSFQNGQTLATVRYDILDPANGTVTSSGEYSDVSLFNLQATFTENGVLFFGTVEDPNFFPTEMGFIEVGFDGMILTPQTIVPGNPQNENYTVLTLDDGTFLLINSESGTGPELTNFDIDGAVLGEIVTIPNTGNITALIGADLLADGRVIISHTDNQGDIVTTTYDTRSQVITDGTGVNDDLVGTLDDDVLTGDSGADRLYGLEGDDVINGGTGNDTLFGGSGADRFIFSDGEGADIIGDFESEDSVSLELAPTTSLSDLQSMMTNFAGYVVLNLGSGNSIRFDGLQITDFTLDNFEFTGIELITTGDSGDNILRGDRTNETLRGFDGDDTLEGGGGADILDGGAGSDTAVYETSTNRVIINMATDAASSGHATGDTFISIENITGSRFGDTITGDGGGNIISGGAGFDVLAGFRGDDAIYGGEGNDFMTGGAGADIIDGGAGSADVARYVGSNAGVTIDLGAGTASGGHAEGDVLTNVEFLFGSSFNDNLTGDANNNWLFGANGDDTLDGAGGIDKFFGGAGSDTFTFSAGDDFVYVTDFVNDVDKIDLSAYGFADLAEALSNFDQRGVHTRFFADGDTLFILNTDLDDLSNDIVI